MTVEANLWLHPIGLLIVFKWCMAELNLYYFQVYNKVIQYFCNCIPYKVIITYWLYSLCCTWYPCILLILHTVVCTSSSMLPLPYPHPVVTSSLFPVSVSLFLFGFYGAQWAICRIFVLWPGILESPLQRKCEVLTNRTAREVPVCFCLHINFLFSQETKCSSSRYAGLAGLLQPAPALSFCWDMDRSWFTSWMATALPNIRCTSQEGAGAGAEGWKRQAEPAPSKNILEAPLDDPTNFSPPPATELEKVTLD